MPGMIQSKVADIETGIPSNVLSKIRDVLCADSRAEAAVLFGSRAKGTWREGSDIDIAVFGSDLTIRDTWSWLRELDDAVFPWSIDFVVVNEHTSAPLREHIARVGMPLCE